MIRAVIRPVNNNYILNLPDEMIGKTVEVIAFEIEPNAVATDDTDLTQRLESIKERYSRYPVISHDNFQFNRDEANDYE